VSVLRAEELGVRGPVYSREFSFSKTLRMTLGPTKPGCLPRVERPGREIDHIPQCDTYVKNECSYSSTPLMCLFGVDRDNIRET
jgi:hypothetical protein